MIAAIATMMLGAVSATGPEPRCDAREMIPLLKRHEIQVLLAAGFSAVQVARRASVSVRTVRRVSEERAVDHADDAVERRTRALGRPRKTTEFSDRVREWLRGEADLPTQELLRRAREHGYAGQKSAFYAMVAAVRPARGSPIVRFEGLPGEFSQHDFGHVDVRFVGGRTKRVHFFASRLKYSRFAAVSLVQDERVETVVRSMARHFVEFGGLPLLAVFDRPRTIVKRSGRGREVEEWNATFAQAVVDIGVGIEMCAPASGNQKGSVERLVGWVKSCFFKPRKFLDEQDLEAQLAAWVLEVNTRTRSRATGEIPETLRQRELPRLRPVKLFPESLALRIPVFVGPTAEVLFEGQAYSMPPEAVHIAGTLFLYEKSLRIVAGRHEVEHRRRQKGEPPEPHPAHRAAKIAALHGARAVLYEKRQQVLNLGADALTLLTEITHRNQRRSAEHVEQLFDLLEEHGDGAMRTAIAKAVARGRLSVSAVREMLASSSARGRGDEVPPAPAAHTRDAEPSSPPPRRRRAASPRGTR
jgi:transposase